ncbi:MAG: hypothetical protein ACI9HH_005452, partial [Pseudomonadota bacterium]
SRDLRTEYLSSIIRPPRACARSTAHFQEQLQAFVLPRNPLPPSLGALGCRIVGWSRREAAAYPAGQA